MSLNDSLRDPRLALGQRLAREVLEPMKVAFVGKDEIIDLLGVCLVAGENLFVLGPPGTAKSAVVHDLGRRLDGRTFEYLLTRFTEPNEIFGPFDIRELRQGNLVTNTEGMLPEASLVFLDELLNANSAILNSLLTALNERVFRRGKETRRLPTLMVVGAGNRLPDDEALVALFDRFLLRVPSHNVPPDDLEAVLGAGWKLEMDLEAPRATVNVEDVRALHGLLRQADLSGVRQCYVRLVHRLRQAGIPVSDRRAVKFQRLAAASALLCGRTEVAVSDLWVLRYTWDTLEQQEVIRAIVQDALDEGPEEPLAHPRSRPAEMPDAESLARDIEAIETRLQECNPRQGDPEGQADAGGAGSNRAELSYLRDRLGILAGRCQWLESDDQRSYLLDRVDTLLKSFGGEP